MVPDPSSGAWPRIRYDYEHTDRPVDAICAEHRISAGTLRNRIRRWNWTQRRPPVPREGPPPAPAPQFGLAAPLPAARPPAPEGNDAAPAPTMPPGASGETAEPPRMDDDGVPVGARLQAALARVIPAIEATVAKLGAASAEPRETERAARSLAALTRTLRELNTLLKQYPAPAANDRGPEDNDEFLLDLARRMDLFAAQHAADDGTPPEGT